MFILRNNVKNNHRSDGLISVIVHLVTIYDGRPYLFNYILPIHRRNAKITILAVAPISYLVHEVTIHDGRPSILLLFTFKLSLQDLIEELKSELGGNYETVCIGLCLSPAEFDAKCLHNAIKVIISKTSSF